ncbi:MAG: TolC family protein [Bryobacterales bacterium]|nr:TolC family protein [Bryobacterales bacterium]
MYNRLSIKTSFFPLLALLLSAAFAPLRGANITLLQALELAEQNHPQLRAGSAQVDVARAGMITAKAYPNPEAGFRAGGQDYRVPGNVRGFVSTYQFSQPLELGPLRPARMEVADRGRVSSELALDATRLAVLSNVRRTFYQALRKREEIGILNENLRLVEEFRKRLQVRVDVGEAGRLELYRADAEVATARTAANSARLQYVAGLSQLRAAIGTAFDPNLSIEGAVDPAVTLPPLEELRKEMIGRHPMLRFARSEIERSESRLKYEVALKRPQPSLVVEVDRPPDVPIYRAGINIPLPFWNKREGPIAEATAQIRQTRALAESNELQLLAALGSAYERYQLATTQLELFEQGLLQEAEAGLRAAETAYRLGERGILEVLDAQRVLRTVRLDLLNAQFDRQAALVDLEELRAIDPRRRP